MSPEAVISGAVSNGFAAELKRIRGVDGEGWGRITTPGEDVEDHIGRMDALGQRLGAGGFHGVQPVGEDRDEDVDHLAVTIIDTAQFPAHGVPRTRSIEGGSSHSLNGAPFLRAPGLRARTGT